jgi:hypothetical protein
MAPKEEETGLTKEEACQILQVASTADRELITQAYWHLARKYRSEMARDPEAQQRLDELNEAYLILNPGQTEAPLPKEPPPFREESDLASDAVAWFRELIDDIAGRWPGHAPEIAVLAATTAILTLLAISSGASAIWTFLAAGVAAVTIWAPWRRS